ncbi:lysosomal acid glucosylceramidase-like [Osmia bicornis bicornis]|uniref:lysosomal acid glucosylceramidase-like n=1 Tax=Osmia bicornis bicornis TaxID=1437191 RepID=UPI001EAEC767|nr:lysosomal acid glucosylceramidase-like [Osmia bicornis bicornis]
MWWKVLLLTPFLIAIGSTNECVHRDFGEGFTVCVCNATYCDTIAKPGIQTNGSFYSYVSSKAGLRMKPKEGQFGSCQQTLPTDTLTIDTTEKYQTIYGFGGAFTDAAGINIKKLSEAAQDQLIRTYYHPTEGSRYLLGRLGIGGTDFSTRAYSYDSYPNDTSLEHFALAPEDYNYKIPFMKKALELNPETKFFGATWAPPSWMKTRAKNNGYGFLKEEYYQLYAEYLVKFLDAYKENGLKIWAISTGNEPLFNYLPTDAIEVLGWTAKGVGTWVANNLGPTLAASQHSTKILALDDNRNELPWFVPQMFENEKAKNYVSGIAVHWYSDHVAPPSVLDLTHDSFPDKFILMTEACLGNGSPQHVILGSWEHGQKYMLSILEYLNNWAIGWVDWNLVLDKNGGPNFIDNYVDSPIIVNPETDEFYKQPMYYAIAHFSRFIDRGSVRISITDTATIKSAAFVTPSNEVVVVLHNGNSVSKNVVLKDLKKGTICLELPANSMHTVIYGL